MSTADIANVFYGMAVPEELGGLFTLPAVRAKFVSVSMLDGEAVGSSYGMVVVCAYLPAVGAFASWRCSRA